MATQSAALQQDPTGNTGIEMRKRFSTIGFQGKKLALINRGNNGYTISGIAAGPHRRASDVPLLNGVELDVDARALKENDVVSIAGIEMEFYYIQ